LSSLSFWRKIVSLKAEPSGRFSETKILSGLMFTFEQAVYRSAFKASPSNLKLDRIEEDLRLDFVSSIPVLRSDLKEDNLTFP
jgi:hypothetical protein